jgi:hypothetical protein
MRAAPASPAVKAGNGGRAGAVGRFLAGLALLLAAPVWATVASTVGPITFDDPPFTDGAAVDGFVLTEYGGKTIDPLTFGFTLSGVPSTSATFTSAGPTYMYVQTPDIDGPVAGVLTLDFGVPVSRVSFGFAFQLYSDPLSTACTVTAYDSSGKLVATTTASAAVTAGSSTSEGQVDFSSANHFQRIQISFSDPYSFDEFALDNLSYDPAPETIPALDGAALAGLALLLAALGAAALKKN